MKVTRRLTSQRNRRYHKIRKKTIGGFADRASGADGQARGVTKFHEPVDEQGVQCVGFGIGQGQFMYRRAFNVIPSRARSPYTSPGICFGIKQTRYAWAAGNVEMAQAP